MIEVCQATDVGKVRPNNEDNLACIFPQLYVIADGMGGHAAGELASSIVVQTAREKVLPDEPIDEMILKAIILQANEAILEKVRQDQALAGMGSTATLLHIDGDMGYWAHVGDSRLYLCRADELRQVTRDHSLVSSLVESGSITLEEARVHPQRNVITRAVGVERDLQVDTGSFSLEAGDVLLLCSDGLTSVMENDEIRDVLISSTVQDKATVLIERALAAESRDNISAIVLRYV